MASNEAQNARYVAGRTSLVLILVLGGANFLNFMERIIFSVLLEPIKLEMDFSDTEMGFLGGFAFALVFGICGLLMGFLSDRMNRGTLLAGAVGFWSLATMLCGAAAGFGTLVIARSMVGLGVAATSPAEQSLIGDRFEPSRQPMAISIVAGMGAIGSIVGIFMGSWVLGRHGWREAFLLVGIVGILFSPVVYFCVKDERKNVRRPIREEIGIWKSAVSKCFGRPDIMCTVLSIPLLFILTSVSTWLPAYFQRAFDLTATQAGNRVGSTLGIGLVVGTFLGGWAVSVLSRKSGSMDWNFWWPSLAAVVATPFLVAFYLVSDLQFASVLLFLGFLVVGTSLGTSYACVVVVSDSGDRGTMISLVVLAVAMFTYGFGPLLVGGTSDLMTWLGIDDVNGDSLRIALMVPLVFPVIGAYGLWKAHGHWKVRQELVADVADT